MEKLRLKVLVMGLTGAGKTAIIRQLLYGLSSEELGDLQPTKLIKVYPDYDYDNYLSQIFECGGQESMFEEYYRPERAERLFSKVNIFLYVVDSGNNAESIKLAIREFLRSIRRVTKYSPQALPIIFAHKQDLSAHLPPEEVASILLKPDKTKYETYLPRELADRGRVENMLRKALVYGTSIEEPIKSPENREAWIRSDNAVIEVLEEYKKFLR